MTFEQSIRLAAFLLGSYAVGQSLLVAVRFRYVPWHQALRFYALALGVGIVAVGQATHWHHPLTGFTYANFCFVALAALGASRMRP